MAAARVQADKVFWRLLGTALFGMGVSVIIALVVPLIQTGAGNEVNVEYGDSLLLNFLTNCMLSCMSVAMAVILCNAYRGLYADRAS